MSNSKWTLLAVFLLSLFILLPACGEDDDTSPSDGDAEKSDVTENDEDGDLDGTSETAEEEIVAEEESPAELEEAEQGETIRGDFHIDRGAGVVLTPSAYTADLTYGDGSWLTVKDFQDTQTLSNFGFSAAGFELGYGDLSSHVKIAANLKQMLKADNGSVKWTGPYSEKTTIPTDERTYVLMTLFDGFDTYYLRLTVTLIGASGVTGSYEFSTNPKFP